MSDLASRPFRSALYIPAANARAMEKALSLDVDAIIFDLEDAVAASEKDAARAALAQALRADYGGRYRLVRVNGADTPWGADDLAAVRGMDCDAILLPKVGSAAAVAGLAAPGRPVWAMMETPAGILNAAAIAAAPGIAGLVLGTNDLAKDLGSRARPDRLPLMTALQTCILAARAHGLVCLDGVYNAFRDEAGLDAECAQGRDLGFDGKTLIHPAQVPVANAAFAPTEAELDLARRQIAAWAEAQAQGKGVAVVDGRIVENLHIVTARALLAKSEARGGRR
jgi:(3S)-malyl-CoA thioesterase